MQKKEDFFRKVFFLFLAVFVLLFQSSLVYASEDLVSVVKKIRPSVVLIVTLDEEKKPLATGSGFIVSPNGYIVTNNHVIEKSAYVLVVFDKTLGFTDKDRYTRAFVVKVNQEIDLAVLKVERNNLPYLDIDYRDPDIGESIIIIGYPIASNIGASDITISKGLLTSKKDIMGNSFLQTDATVNPGNSGGPLVSPANKKVIGIVRLKVKSDAVEGIGFAIPVTEARSLLADYCGVSPKVLFKPSVTKREEFNLSKIYLGKKWTEEEKKYFKMLQSYMDKVKGGFEKLVKISEEVRRWRKSPEDGLKEIEKVSNDFKDLYNKLNSYNAPSSCSMKQYNFLLGLRDVIFGLDNFVYAIKKEDYKKLNYGVDLMKKGIIKMNDSIYE